MKFIRLFLLLFIGQAQAQVFYPVVARLSQQAPYPVYFMDYSNPLQTSLSVQIQQNDPSISSRSIRLKMWIEGQGYLIESTDVVQGEPIRTLNYGQIYTLSSNEVANYFKQYNLKMSAAQYSKPLPEGSVRFGVQVLDYQTNRALSGIQWGAPIWISRNEPPVWVMPQNQDKIVPTPVPNVVFQWAPRHGSIGEVTYEFTLKELVYNTFSMGNVQNVFLSQPAYYTARTSATVLTYTATMPPLIPGRIYAYRVRALSSKGLELFNNFGYSEVQVLYYGNPKVPIRAPEIETAQRNELKNEFSLSWTGSPEHTAYTLAYREKEGVWKTKVLPSLSLFYTFLDLDASKSYEIKVGAQDEYQQEAYSSSVFLEALPAAKVIPLEGRVLWAFAKGEDALTDKNPLFERGEVKARSIRTVTMDEALNSTAYPLQEAQVSLFSGDREGGSLKLIRHLETDQHGRFRYDSLLLTPEQKYLFLQVDHGAGPFEKIFMPYHPEKPLEDIVLKAKTLRYSPRFIATSAPAMEQVELYRLKSLRTQFPWLRKEAGGHAGEKIFIYNHLEYELVADMQGNPSVGGLFGNAAFKDQYLLRIKAKGRKELVYPLENIAYQKNARVIDYFNYLPLYHQFKGGVKKGGQALPNAPVQAWGKTVYTDQDGNFTMDILTQKAGKFEVRVLDPLFHANFVREELTYADEDLTRNFEISNGAFFMEGRVLDPLQKPAVGAIVTIDKQTVRTDALGWFAYQGTVEPTSIHIRMPGFDALSVPITAFLRKNVETPEAFSQALQEGHISDKQKYYEDNFTALGWECKTYLGKHDISLTKSYPYRIIAFKEKSFTALNMVNVSDSTAFVSSTVKVEGKTVKVPVGKAQQVGGVWKGTGGYLGRSTGPTVKISTFNASGLDIVVEEDLYLHIPEEATDTTTFLIQIKEGVLFKGQVQDSTLYIEGIHTPGSVKKAGQKLNVMSGVSIHVSHLAQPVVSNGSGNFQLYLPVNQDVEFLLTKPGYAKTRTVIPRAETNDFQSGRKLLYMVQIDTNTIPKIDKFMGFPVAIDRLVVNSGSAQDSSSRLYLLSGKIPLDKEEVTSLENAFGFSSQKNLSFKDLLVRVERDDDGSGNAVLVASAGNLTHTQFPAKLFGYAPVVFKGDAKFQPYLRMEHVQGSPGQGKVVASSFEFTQSKMAGLNFGTMKLLDAELDPEGELPAAYTAFSSLPLAELSSSKEYRILFGSRVSASNLQKEGIDTTQGSYYQAEFSATHISGVYSAMNLYLNRESASLTQDGIDLEGYFTLPKIWKFKNSGPLTVSSMSINTSFNLEQIELAKSPNSKKGEIAKIAVGSKWMLYVNSFIISNNFKGFGFAGKLEADKENYLDIKTFSIAKVDGDYFPALSLATPEKGLVFKNIKFTTLKGKTVRFVRNVEDKSYEVDASFKLEYVAGNKSNATIERLSKKIFPLTIERFVWSTSGKLLVAITPGNAIELGPVKVNVRRLIYTKGAVLSKGEINEMLAMNEAEAEAWESSKRFDAEFSEEETEARDAISVDALFVEELADEVSELDPAAKWAFAFSGGVALSSTGVKGMQFDSDLSFILGDFGGGMEFQLNEIAMKLESSGFKASGKLKIETGEERVGFEGQVTVETVKLKLAGSFKFYQLYYITSGNKKGIELGASLLATSKVVMGSLTWTSLGGGFDLNTAKGTYKFFFMGSAINTGVPESVVEYRNINVSVAFDTQNCGALPVIKGSMSLFINKESYCNGSIELDFCVLRVIGKIACEKEFAKSVKVKMNALIIASKDGFLAGCYVQTKLLNVSEMQANFALAIQFNTKTKLANELLPFLGTVPNYMLHQDNVTMSGVLFGIGQWENLSSKGSVSIQKFEVVGYEAVVTRLLSLQVGVNFNRGTFKVSTGQFGAMIFAGIRVSILGYGINGGFSALANFDGGYTETEGWHVAARVSGKIEAYNDPGKNMACNTINLRWSNHTVAYYPCGISCSWKFPEFWEICSTDWCALKVPLPNVMDGIGVKVCIGGSVGLSYAERGSNAGWKFSL